MVIRTVGDLVIPVGGKLFIGGASRLRYLGGAMLGYWAGFHKYKLMYNTNFPIHYLFKSFFFTITLL